MLQNGPVFASYLSDDYILHNILIKMGSATSIHLPLKSIDNPNILS